ncbi:unnamed protein product [Nyctereutes procyonoides]|uniref:(raccoon dog) hypothetical protein n=1 Tax=Nyctereutes procyonoides TaxID=34880 RepID=A0A811YB18_NYCPR|nr:unnamed protein product [Nyctereutes procyonoides]
MASCGHGSLIKVDTLFKRYQVKPRRKQEDKMDYNAQKHLLTQDKIIICQIAHAYMEGDMIACAVNAHELSKYGVKTRLTKHAAPYHTDLLDKIYEGQVGVTRGNHKEDCPLIRPGLFSCRKMEIEKQGFQILSQSPQTL